MTTTTDRPVQMARGATPARDRRSLRTTARTPVVLVACLAVWEVAVRAFDLASGALPAPSAIAAELWNERSLWPQPLLATATEAGMGFALAVGIALTIAALCVVFGWAERTVSRIALAIYCLPLIAVAPLFNLLFPGIGSKVALAALTAFFPILIAVLAGVRNAPSAALELVYVYGGGSGKQLRYVRIHGAIAGLVSGMKVAAPAAVLGALIGELVGAERGLGVLMLSSQHGLDVDRTYATAVVAAALAAAGFLIGATLERLLPPGFRGGDDVSSTGTQRSLAQRSRTTLLVGIATTALLLILWWLAVATAQVSPILMKDPAGLFEYLVEVPAAARNRAVLLDALAVTAGHIAVGAVAGLSVTLVAAVLYLLLPVVRQPLMTVAIVFQTIPTVAFVPVIAVLLGRGLAAVALAGAICVVFPTLVVVIAGLRSVSIRVLDVGTVYGANRWTLLWRIQFPAAVPALFAALRISVPNAVIGALLVEWMITGTGLGRLMTSAGSVLNYGAIWGSVVLLTVLTALAYSLVSTVERIALSRFAPHALMGRLG
jgi:ABC-type nitrate/sulfonate/bicarbonate transport system permease component